MRLADPAFRAIFEDSPIGICVVDRNLKVVDANAAYCDMLGRTEAEVMDAHVPDFTHPDERALSEIQPVCPSCRRVREQDGRWSDLETFLHASASAAVSRQRCPDCL